MQPAHVDSRQNSQGSGHLAIATTNDYNRSEPLEQSHFKMSSGGQEMQSSAHVH
jgi:hypothetical protein